MTGFVRTAKKQTQFPPNAANSSYAARYFNLKKKTHARKYQQKQVKREQEKKNERLKKIFAIVSCILWLPVARYCPAKLNQILCVFVFMACRSGGAAPDKVVRG